MLKNMQNNHFFVPILRLGLRNSCREVHVQGQVIPIFNPRIAQLIMIAQVANSR